MKPTNTCFALNDVAIVLSADASPVELTNAEVHLAECESCRGLFESAIADSGWWEDARNSLFASKNRTDVHESRSTTTEQILELLGPTDDPAMLGRIGTYEIVGLLGQGGMGAVFKGFDAALNRFVAIKILLPYLAVSGAARKRFAREAQAAAAVVDDHVMPIHGVSEWKSVPYFVMPYSRGVTLQKRIDQDGPLELREILRIGMQVARGLAAAHAQGLVHRDIKPANIFLDAGVERVQLMDFGLARAVDDASLTRSGTLAGTPQYMSPEQARAETVGHRSDLFSLGSVLYAMCTGHPPFRAESSYGVLRLITDKDPRPIREINPDIPDWLCEIIGKLMRKTVQERFDSAEQVAQLLEDCLAHVQQPTSPLPTIVQPISEHGEPLALPARIPPGRSIWKYLASAAFALSLLLAGVMIVLELSKGTLTIQSEVDDVPIRIMRGDKAVQQLTVSQAGKSIRIAAGNYVVEVDQSFDGAVVHEGRVSLKRGDTESVRITQTAEESSTSANERVVMHSIVASGKVLTRSGEQVEVSIGADDGVRPGDRLNVVNALQSEVEVIHVQNSQSLARIVGEDKSSPISPGAQVILSRPKSSTPEGNHSWPNPSDWSPGVRASGLILVENSAQTTNDKDFASEHDHSHNDIDDHEHDHEHVQTPVQNPSRLLVIDEASQPVTVDAIVRAEFYTSRENHWSRFPDRDKTLSLAGLPTGKNLLVTQPQHDVLSVVSPSSEAITICQVKPAQPDRFKDVACSVDVQQRAFVPKEDAYWIRLTFDNASGKTLSITERDFTLTTILSRPEKFQQFEVLSPHWRRIASQMPQPIEIPPGASGTLILNWNEWVAGGLWISGGAVREAGSWPPVEEPGKVWVRVNAPGFATKPLALPHPESLGELDFTATTQVNLSDSETDRVEPGSNSTQAESSVHDNRTISLQFLESPWREVLQHVADELSLELEIEAEPTGTTTLSELRISDDAAIKALNRTLWDQSIVIRRSSTELKVTPRTLGDMLLTSSSLFPSFVVVPDKSGNPRPPVTIAARDAVVHHPPKWLREVPFPALESAFTRLEFNNPDQKSAWRKGYPEADRAISDYLAFHMGFAFKNQNMALRLTDAKLREQFFVYLSNPSDMTLNDDEVVALRTYLLGGGFLMVDRSWGVEELAALRQVMKRVLPDHEPKSLPLSHPIFHGVYDFQFKPQVPNYTDFDFAMREASVKSALSGGPSIPDLELEPAEFYGYFDHERLMVLVCHNNDFLSGWLHSNMKPHREQLFGHFSMQDYYTRYFGRSQAFPMALNVMYYALTQNKADAAGDPQHSSKPVYRELFEQYVNVNGKISTDTLRSAIEQVATQGAGDHKFRELVVYELVKQCEPDGDRAIRRNLLRLITKWLEEAGEAAWQDESTRQQGIVMPEIVPSRPETSTNLLAKVMKLAQRSDSADIDAFVMAARGAHYPIAKLLFLEVLGNRQAGGDPFEYEKSDSAVKPSDGTWPAPTGGSWRDAKFHAAVALAELGDPIGVEWLIAGTKRNDFGIDGTVFHGAHVTAQSSSLQQNCELALRDLFFGQDKTGQTEKTIDWENHWSQIRDDFVPQAVRLASE